MYGVHACNVGYGIQYEVTWLPTSVKLKTPP